MSVGVCIINNNGIAMAADSAGTLNGGHMFYNSVEKLIRVSEKHSIGAIIYAKLNLCDVAMDQLIKEFGLYMDSVEEFDDFFEIIPLFMEFVSANREYYRFDKKEKNHCSSLIKTLVNEWGNKIKTAFSNEDVDSGIDAVLTELSTKNDEKNSLVKLSVTDYIHRTYRDVYDKSIKKIVPELLGRKEDIERLWKEICRYFDLLLESENKASVGLFFAGYGGKDAFPKCVHLCLYPTIIDGKIKHSVIDKITQSNNAATIIPLAQIEMIKTFCNGISDSLYESFLNIVNDYITKKIGTIEDEKTKDAIVSLFSDREVINAEIQQRIQQDVDRLFESVNLIPLPEMAFLAESLVNITSLKRAYVLDGNQQSVGGPTDVAIVSKVEGFTWVKQKRRMSETHHLQSRGLP